MASGKLLASIGLGAVGLIGAGWYLSKHLASATQGFNASTDKSTYSTGDIVAFHGTGAVPGSQVTPCITVDNASTVVCIAPVMVDTNGNFSGTMQIGGNIPPGPQQIVLHDMTSDAYAKVAITVHPLVATS